MAKKLTGKLAEFEAARSDRAKRMDGTAKDLAVAYVEAHPELSDRYEGRSIENLVGVIDELRILEDPVQIAEIEAWLLFRFPPHPVTAGVGMAV